MIMCDVSTVVLIPVLLAAAVGHVGVSMCGFCLMLVNSGVVWPLPSEMWVVGARIMYDYV